MTTITATYPDGTTEDTVVDAVITEAPTHEATITDHPVEVGANVSDHIQPEPETLRLELVVSNTSPRTPGSVISDAAETVYDTLVQWHAAGCVLSVLTTLGRKSSMAIKSVGTVRDAKTGGPPGKTGGLKIPLSLKAIRFVQNKLTRVVISRDKRVGDKSKTGAQPTTTAKPQSFLATMTDVGASLLPSAHEAIDNWAKAAAR